MQYDEPSEGSDDEEDANLIEMRPGDIWSSDNSDNDEENSDNEDFNKVEETSNEESDSEEVFFSSEEDDMEYVKTT